MHSRSHPIAVSLAVAAIAPYITLKLLWLSGSTIGLRTEAATSKLHSDRMIVGNVITIGLELVAVFLIVGLTRDWGMRVRAWVVLALMGGATGLLAPILLGLPAGGMLQVALDGRLHTSGMDDMSPWVFALVYGGFGALALVIAVLARRYVLLRWESVVDSAPRRPGRRVIALGAVGLLPFAVAMLWWGVRGPGSGGPPQMDAVSQRFTLAVTGALVVAGFVAPLLGSLIERRPRAVRLAIWTGCTTAALQGPTEVLLADHGHPSAAMVLVGLLAVPVAGVYGWVVLRASRATPATSCPTRPPAQPELSGVPAG